MNTNIKNKDGRRSVAWTALLVLSFFAAVGLVVPTVVFAQTYELSQDCETAMVGTEHTITVEVTNGGVPVQGVQLFYVVQGTNPKLAPTPISEVTNEEGIVDFYVTGSDEGPSNIILTTPPPTIRSLASISMEWTADDLCLAPHVDVGGKVTLNAKKRGALKIAVCGTKDFDVSNVDPKSVRLAGVAPFHSKQKDSHLCLDGKDGFVDLVLKFKNRDVVEALGPDLEDTHEVTLALTGNLNDLTAFGGEWVAVIKKKGKSHGKNEQYQDFDNSKSKGKAKGHNK